MSTPSRVGRELSAVLVMLVTLAGLASAQGASKVTPPKVPFGNKPCESLSTADKAALKLPTPLDARPDRAPAGLASDNICTWTSGGTKEAQVGYQTQADFDFNSKSNRSKSRQAPTNFPTAFYDNQAGLWFAKNGYYVVVSGKSAFREPVARLIANKL